MGLQVVTKGCMGLQRGYMRLQGSQRVTGVTRVYRGLHEFTRGYSILHGVTGGYKWLQWVI